VPMPVQARDPFTGRIVKQSALVEVDIDEALLQRIAERTGGEFFRATDPGSLKAIFDRIDQLEKSEIRLTAYQRYRELFPEVLSSALAALAAGGLLFAGGLRVAPA
jgi:Ca-activated chloride channel homolog